jgi:HEAT repeat protein
MRKLLLIGLCLAAGCGKNEPSYQGKSASSWVRALKSPETRPDASRALEELGPAAIPALIDGLRNEDAAVREGATDALRKNGKEAVPALNDALQHPHALVRRQAAYLLSELGPDAGSALVAILEGLKDPNLQVRVCCARAVWKVDKQEDTAVTTLTEILKDSEATPEVRRFALDTLAEIGPNAKPALPQITEALTHESPAVRLSAARAVWQVDRKAPIATDTVLAIVEDPASPVELRRQAIDTLADIGPAARKASPALTKLLADPTTYVRIKAARALWQIDHQALPIVDILRTSLAHQEPTDPDSAAVRMWAAYLLAEIGPEARTAYPDLVKALQDKDDSVRKQVALTFTKIAEPKDTLLIEPLTAAAFRDSQLVVRVNAARALAKVDPSKHKVVVGVVVEGLRDSSADVRRSVVETLGELGPEARTALPQLNAALQDRNVEVRRAAADSLARLGPDARGSVGALTDALKDPDAEVRVRAAQALWKVDKQSLTALPVLMKALSDPSDTARAWAAYTLGDMGPRALEAVPGLIKNLHAKNDRVRKQSAFALGRIGPEAREAVPVLQTLARTDPRPDIKDQADEAVRRITQK